MDKLNQVLLHKDILVGADLDAWLSHGGGEGLAKALDAPEGSSDHRRAGLRGMGGAGFPTHRKWSAAAASSNPVKYVVCNGNEDEPGTFKDQFLLEHAASGDRGCADRGARDPRQSHRALHQSAPGKGDGDGP